MEHFRNKKKSDKHKNYIDIDLLTVKLIQNPDSFKPINDCIVEFFNLISIITKNFSKWENT